LVECGLYSSQKPTPRETRHWWAAGQLGLLVTRIHKHISKRTPVRTGEYAPVELRPESHRIPKG
jgi:hypothetical protein